MVDKKRFLHFLISCTLLSKATYFSKTGLYNTTLEQLVIEEEGTPEEVGLDQAIVVDDEDEEVVSPLVKVVKSHVRGLPLKGHSQLVE